MGVYQAVAKIAPTPRTGSEIRPGCAGNGIPRAPGRRLRPVSGRFRSGVQCPNRSVGANIPFCSKYARASSTVRKIFVAVSVMNGLGFFFGFQTT